MEQLLCPPPMYIDNAVRQALAEDWGRRGDIGTGFALPESLQGRADIVTRQDGCLAGIDIAARVFFHCAPQLHVAPLVRDGQSIAAGTVVARMSGPARAILGGERVALNFLGHLSGIATLTGEFVRRIKGTRAQLLSTRKTTPGLRIFEKYAIMCGGGINHRFGLDDAVMVKDNLIALGGGIAPVMARLRNRLGPMLRVEIEVDTLDQLHEALAEKPDMILLDNMTPGQLREAVSITAGRVPLEASGGVTLENVAQIAQSGVDYISSGALTRSAVGLDFGLDIVPLDSPLDSPLAHGMGRK